MELGNFLVLGSRILPPIELVLTTGKAGYIFPKIHIFRER